MRDQLMELECARVGARVSGKGIRRMDLRVLCVRVFPKGVIYMSNSTRNYP